MKASVLYRKLGQLLAEHGDVPVEVDTNLNLGIVTVKRIRFEETDAERGNTIVIEGNDNQGE